MRKSSWMKWIGALAIAAVLGGIGATQASASFILEVKAISAQFGTVSNGGKTVSAITASPDQITFGIYLTHTLDPDPATDPLRFGLGEFGITVNSQNDTVNGVLTPGAVGNVTKSTLYGGLNDPGNPANGGSGFALPGNFNAFSDNNGDGQLTDAEQGGSQDPDIDLVYLGAAQDIRNAPQTFLPFYGVSQTVGVPVTTLLGTFVFTVNGNVAFKKTSIQIYLPNTTGTFNASSIRALTGSSTAIGGGGAMLGPLFLTSADLGAPVIVSINAPEPTSVVMLGLAAATLVRRRRR